MSLDRALDATDYNVNQPQDGDWIEVSSTSRKHSYLTLRGVNKAGLMGSLYNAKVVSAEEVFLCLCLLLEGEKHFDRLCAMHALLVQANDKLCKSRNLPTLMEFRAQLTIKDTVSGVYKWAPASPAVTIIQVNPAFHRKSCLKLTAGITYAGYS